MPDDTHGAPCQSVNGAAADSSATPAAKVQATATQPPADPAAHVRWTAAGIRASQPGRAGTAARVAPRFMSLAQPGEHVMAVNVSISLDNKRCSRSLSADPDTVAFGQPGRCGDGTRGLGGAVLGREGHGSVVSADRSLGHWGAPRRRPSTCTVFLPMDSRCAYEAGRAILVANPQAQSGEAIWGKRSS